jgi:methyltransferase-like protein 23
VAVCTGKREAESSVALAHTTLPHPETANRLEQYRMDSSNDHQSSILTSAGAIELQEYHLRLAGREWTILHTGALMTLAEESDFLRELKDRVPYGVALWPSSIALAHDVIARGDALRDARVLELGAGTGLPGIVAASLGARVVQTDRHEVALSICKRNGERNRERNAVGAIEYRIADWSTWNDDGRYDFIIGADILYAERLHPYLRQIFESNLASGGRVLLADPFRPMGLRLMEAMEAGGWSIALSKWSVGDEAEARPVGVYEVAR